MNLNRFFLFVFLSFINLNFYAQSQQSNASNQSDFWQKVRFGGGFGLGIGNSFTNIGLSPQAVYQLNEKVGLGAGLQFNYLNQRNFYEAYMTGASALTFFNPIPEVQFSLEIEQLYNKRNYNFTDASDSFWNTAIFLGAGYRTNFAVVGMRYNILHHQNESIYIEAWMPFVRVFF